MLKNFLKQEVFVMKLNPFEGKGFIESFDLFTKMLGWGAVILVVVQYFFGVINLEKPNIFYLTCLGVALNRAIFWALARIGLVVGGIVAVVGLTGVSLNLYNQCGGGSLGPEGLTPNYSFPLILVIVGAVISGLAGGLHMLTEDWFTDFAESSSITRYFTKNGENESEYEQKQKERQRYEDEIAYNAREVQRRREQENQERERRDEAKRLNDEARKLWD